VRDILPVLDDWLGADVAMLGTRRVEWAALFDVATVRVVATVGESAGRSFGVVAEEGGDRARFGLGRALAGHCAALGELALGRDEELDCVGGLVGRGERGTRAVLFLAQRGQEVARVHAELVVVFAQELAVGEKVCRNVARQCALLKSRSG